MKVPVQSFQSMHQQLTHVGLSEAQSDAPRLKAGSEPFQVFQVFRLSRPLQAFFSYAFHATDVVYVAVVVVQVDVVVVEFFIIGVVFTVLCSALLFLLSSSVPLSGVVVLVVEASRGVVWILVDGMVGAVEFCVAEAAHEEHEVSVKWGYTRYLLGTFFVV